MTFDRAVLHPFSAKPSVYERIKAAAKMAGKTTSEFIREATLIAVEKVEQEHAAQPEANEK